MKIAIGVLFVLAFASQTGSSQTLVSPQTMSQGEVCIGVMYSHESFRDMWRGDQRYFDPNLGGVTMNAVMGGVFVGLSESVQLSLGLPFVSAQARAGFLRGQSNFQDLSGQVRYKAYEQSFDESNLVRIYGQIGASLPVSDYVADHMVSIGRQSTTADLRILGEWQHSSGLYSSAQAGYTRRGNSTTFQWARVGESSNRDVMVPDVFDFALALGYREGNVIAEAFYQNSDSRGGNTLRPGVVMQTIGSDFQRVGLSATYYNFIVDGLNPMASVYQVLDGENYFALTGIGVGVAYAFQAWGGN